MAKTKREGGELCHSWQQSAIPPYGVARMHGILRVWVDNGAGISHKEWPRGQLPAVRGYWGEAGVARIKGGFPRGQLERTQSVSGKCRHTTPRGGGRYSSCIPQKRYLLEFCLPSLEPFNAWWWQCGLTQTFLHPHLPRFLQTWRSQRHPGAELGKRRRSRQGSQLIPWEKKAVNEVRSFAY